MIKTVLSMRLMQLVIYTRTLEICQKLPTPPGVVPARPDHDEVEAIPGNRRVVSPHDPRADTDACQCVGRQHQVRIQGATAGGGGQRNLSHAGFAQGRGSRAPAGEPFDFPEQRGVVRAAVAVGADGGERLRDDCAERDQTPASRAVSSTIPRSLWCRSIRKPGV